MNNAPKTLTANDVHIQLKHNEYKLRIIDWNVFYI